MGDAEHPHAGVCCAAGHQGGKHEEAFELAPGHVGTELPGHGGVAQHEDEVAGLVVVPPRGVAGDFAAEYAGDAVAEGVFERGGADAVEAVAVVCGAEAPLDIDPVDEIVFAHGAYCLEHVDGDEAPGGNEVIDGPGAG